VQPGVGVYRILNGLISDDGDVCPARRPPGTATTVTAWARPSSLSSTATLHLCTIANRLVVAANNRIAFSPINTPTGFVADDYHELPGGVIVVGLAAIRDTLLIFTNFGLWTVTNMAYDLTDAAGNVQQALALVTPELSLWHEAGLCEWSGQIVAPCLDRTVIVDGVNAPQPITNSIAPWYAQLVAAGYTPGAAKVYRNHLFLPILNGGEPYAMLVCRLDRPVRGRQLYFPWSTFTGHAQKGTAFDVALTGATPDFILAGRDRRITSLRDVFDPAQAVASDADGTTHEFDVETRDFPTGGGQPNHVRRVRLRYTLDAPGGAQIAAGYSYGSVGQTYEAVAAHYATYGAITGTYENLRLGLDAIPPTMPRSADDPDRFWYALDVQPTPNDRGTALVAWPLPATVRVRYARVRFRTTAALAKLVIHRCELHVRQAAHNR
jgi:hypothetical protein